LLFPPKVSPRQQNPEDGDVRDEDEDGEDDLDDEDCEDEGDDQDDEADEGSDEDDEDDDTRFDVLCFARPAFDGVHARRKASSTRCG